MRELLKSIDKEELIDYIEELCLSDKSLKQQVKERFRRILFR